MVLKVLSIIALILLYKQVNCQVCFVESIGDGICNEECLSQEFLFDKGTNNFKILFI